LASASSAIIVGGEGGDIGFAADVGIKEVDNIVEGELGFGEVLGTTVSKSIGFSSLEAIQLRARQKSARSKVQSWYSLVCRITKGR